jgi:hypothetical protein
MTHKVVFLVTSAINVDTGVLGTEERLSQMIDTAKSIRERVYDCKIILIDGGIKPLTVSHRQNLLEIYDDILDLSYHPQILTMHRLANEKEDHRVRSFIVKGPCETFLLSYALELLPKDEECRYFKISGRYKLSDSFDLDTHLVQSKYVFKKKDSGVLFEGSDVNYLYTEYQYKTRLYSFCGTIFDQVKNHYNQIFEHIISCYSQNSFIDLEHATYKIIGESLVHGVQSVGCVGIQADNGAIIDE